ncbi:Pao retrotransposon peptidase family protein [Daphnia sinensis]|uniref:Pao retrotransposon peptidase family protein n=1 Tax=Daphnia sinensis TaxID=1820382 RepID=A0AAD5Q101_9CRUS|nr:Pao retrotransposon peptidase family protein [Daphnia sinensis]
MSLVLALAKNKREEYKRRLDAEFQDHQHAFPKGKLNILKEISLSGRHFGRASTPPSTPPQCRMGSVLVRRKSGVNGSKLQHRHQLQKEWSASDANDITDITALLTFIRDQVDAAERYSRWKSETQNTLLSTQQENFVVRQCTRPCIFCGEIHFPTNCPINLKDKKAIIARQKRCVRCFSANHETGNCHTTYLCKHCQATHHTALCDRKVVKFTNTTNNAPTNVTASVSSANTYGDLMVKTATVRVVGPNGKETRAILFIDDGSHRSWVTRSISKLLNLRVVAEENIGTRVFKQRKPNPVERINAVELTIRGTWKGAPPVKITALETDYIGDTGPYSHTAFARQLWLEDEKMADDRFETNSQEKEVGILIGVDQMFEIIPNEPAIQSTCGLRAYNTKLEKAIIQQMLQCSSFSNCHTVSSYAAGCFHSQNYFTNHSENMEKGKAEESSPPQPRPTEEISSQEQHHTSKKEKRKIAKEELKRQTDFDLSLFWKLEHFAILDDCDAVEPDDTLCSFGDKITRQEDGRYCTPIPWKTDKWRLKRTPELLSAYHKEIDQLQVQNFVEEADLNYEGLHTYLPHHPVIRQDKTTTKIRPVFDGAAKSKYGPSLNDVLETGPNLNPDLLAVLMRFRLHKIAWIADIEKAFLNIALHPDDAEAIRFLWITDPQKQDSPLVHLDGMEPLYSTTDRGNEIHLPRSKTQHAELGHQRPNSPQISNKLSGPNWWRHCPGVQNPADLASRGAPAATLVHSELWWNGPSWLKEDESMWPDPIPEIEEPSVRERIEAEARSKIVTMSIASVEPATPVEWHLDRIPSWNRLLRRTAWILRVASKNRPTNATQHAGVKTTLSDLRERFWIVKGRQQTKSVWHACVKCQRLTSPPFREVAAPLPINRLKQAKAFEITGVDFAGPLYYKHPISRKKRKQLREDQPEDVEVPPTPEQEPDPEEATPSVSATDPADQEEPWTTGSGGECVGNVLHSQQPTTRAGRRTRLPKRFLSFDLGGPLTSLLLPLFLIRPSEHQFNLKETGRSRRNVTSTAALIQNAKPTFSFFGKEPLPRGGGGGGVP